MHTASAIFYLAPPSCHYVDDLYPLFAHSAKKSGSGRGTSLFAAPNFSCAASLSPRCRFIRCTCLHFTAGLLPVPACCTNHLTSPHCCFCVLQPLHLNFSLSTPASYSAPACWFVTYFLQTIVLTKFSNPPPPPPPRLCIECMQHAYSTETSSDPHSCLCIKCALKWLCSVTTPFMNPLSLAGQTLYLQGGKGSGPRD